MLLKDKKYIVLCRKILPIICIWIFTFFVGTKAIYLPGIYYDAVYPDYLAAIGAFPGVDNFTQITRHVGLPLLGNFYHGTMTAGFQYIILKCIGHASQFTLRATNLAYFAVIGNIIYILCSKVSKSSIIPLAGTLLCVTAPNVLTIPRTQYYIMLPGCVFLFCSIFLLYTDMDRSEEFKSNIILLAGIFQGLAFYGYFTYLFFAPAAIILISFFSKDSKIEKLKKDIVYIWGILIGSIGYFIGYYDSILTNFFGEVMLTRILLWCGILCMIIYLAIPVYLSWRHGKGDISRKIMRVFLIVNVILIFLACAVCAIIPLLYKKSMQSVLSLLVRSQTRNEGNRFLVFWDMMYMLVSSKSAQNLIFGETLNGLFGAFFYLAILMTAAVTVIAVCAKRRGEKDLLLKYIGTGYLYLASYYIFTLPISVGMQPQHFVAAYFLLFLIIILDTVYLGKHMVRWINIPMGLAVLMIGIYLNITNDMAFLMLLDQTEGRGKFSSSLDKLAEEARWDEEKANKIYVFPQWGFYANFVYLTENSCMAIRDADINYEILQEKLNLGYILVIAAFEKQEIDNIVEKLQFESCEWQEVKSKEGDYVFTCVTITFSS